MPDVGLLPITPPMPAAELSWADSIAAIQPGSGRQALIVTATTSPRALAIAAPQRCGVSGAPGTVTSVANGNDAAIDRASASSPPAATSTSTRVVISGAIRSSQPRSVRGELTAATTTLTDGSLMKARR